MISSDLHVVDKLVRKLGHPGKELRVCYEAGPCGFVRVRGGLEMLEAAGAGEGVGKAGAGRGLGEGAPWARVREPPNTNPTPLATPNAGAGIRTSLRH